MNQPIQVLNEIAQKVREQVQAETAIIALAASGGESVYYAAGSGKHAAMIVGKAAPAATSGLCGVVFAENQSVLVCQTQGDSRIRQDVATMLGIQTALAAPLYYQEQLLGALMVLNRIDGSLFDEQAEQRLIEYAAEIATEVYQNIPSEMSSIT